MPYFPRRFRSLPLPGKPYITFIWPGNWLPISPLPLDLAPVIHYDLHLQTGLLYHILYRAAIEPDLETATSAKCLSPCADSAIYMGVQSASAMPIVLAANRVLDLIQDSRLWC